MGYVEKISMIRKILIFIRKAMKPFIATIKEHCFSKKEANKN